jgi:hypothetical protein
MKDIGATEGSGLRHRLYKLSNNPLAKDVV